MGIACNKRVTISISKFYILVKTMSIIKTMSDLKGMGPACVAVHVPFWQSLEEDYIILRHLRTANETFLVYALFSKKAREFWFLRHLNRLNLFQCPWGNPTSRRTWELSHLRHRSSLVLLRSKKVLHRTTSALYRSLKNIAKVLIWYYWAKIIIQNNIRLQFSQS